MFLPFSGQHQRADPTRTRLIQHVMTKYKMKVTFTYMIHKTLKKKKRKEYKDQVTLIELELLAALLEKF